MRMLDSTWDQITHHSINVVKLVVTFYLAEDCSRLQHVGGPLHDPRIVKVDFEEAMFPSMIAVKRASTNFNDLQNKSEQKVVTAEMNLEM